MNLKPLLDRITQIEQREHERKVIFLWDKGLGEDHMYGPYHTMTQNEYIAWCHAHYDNPEIYVFSWVDPNEY